MAVTAVSASLPAAEREFARSSARARGLRHIRVHAGEQDRPEYPANGGNRCRHCGSALFDALAEPAELSGPSAAPGTGPDGPGGHRPGCGRPPSGARWLRRWMPARARRRSAPWRARWSRIPVSWTSPRPPVRLPGGPRGPVTPEVPARTERAEASVEALGFAGCRVRAHAEDPVARLDCPRATSTGPRRCGPSRTRRYGRRVSSPAPRAARPVPAAAGWTCCSGCRRREGPGCGPRPRTGRRAGFRRPRSRTGRRRAGGPSRAAGGGVRARQDTRRGHRDRPAPADGRPRAGAGRPPRRRHGARGPGRGARRAVGRGGPAAGAEARAHRDLRGRVAGAGTSDGPAACCRAPGRTDRPGSDKASVPTVGTAGV
ncbi:hypothetical protein SUDANB6_00834 [Streptomyces sp. enrichment culture]